jgi:hypothetical protein
MISEKASGACDATMIDILLAHAPGETGPLRQRLRGKSNALGTKRFILGALNAVKIAVK